MKRAFLVLFFQAQFVAHAQWESPEWLKAILPAQAQVIEAAEIKTLKQRSRLMVLWMLRPEKVMPPDRLERGCSEGIYGSHWSGPGRLSLVDQSSHVILNTISIQGSDFGEDRKEDRFSLPFWVSKDAYEVPHPDKNNEGTPHILKLRDLTGEGIEGQFLLFEYQACGAPVASILGYSSRTDKVLQYRYQQRFNSDPLKSGFWLSQTFRMKQRRPGLWAHTWDPGHGCDCVIQDRVTFDPRRQTFLVHSTSKPNLPTPKKAGK